MKKPTYMALSIVGKQAANNYPMTLTVYRGPSREIADRISTRERRKGYETSVVKVLRTPA